MQKYQIKSDSFRDLSISNLIKIDEKYLRYNVLSLVAMLMLNLIEAATFAEKQSNKKVLIRAVDCTGSVNFYLIKDFVR